MTQSPAPLKQGELEQEKRQRRLLTMQGISQTTVACASFPCPSNEEGKGPCLWCAQSAGSEGNLLLSQTRRQRPLAPQYPRKPFLAHQWLTAAFHHLRACLGVAGDEKGAGCWQTAVPSFLSSMRPWQGAPSVQLFSSLSVTYPSFLGALTYGKENRMLQESVLFSENRPAPQRAFYSFSEIWKVAFNYLAIRGPRAGVIDKKRTRGHSVIQPDGRWRKSSHLSPGTLTECGLSKSHVTKSAHRD